MIVGLLITLALILVTTFGFRFLTSRWIYTEPNEWLLIVRDGKLLHSGIGTSFQAQFWDRVVRFPSRIFKVNFYTHGISFEMQGVGVSGTIVWSVDPEGDGPLRAYKFFGKELAADVPEQANSRLEEVGSAVVRHRIANSSLEEIMQNRSLIRNEMLSELRRVCTGWGVAVDSVEITEVKILSNSVFENMQAPFSEEQRIKATFISLNTEAELKEKQVKADLQRSRFFFNDTSTTEIYTFQQQLKISEDNLKNAQHQAGLEKQKRESEYKNKLEQFERSHKFSLEEEKRAFNTKLQQLDLKIEHEKKSQELMDVQEQSKMQQLREKLARAEETQSKKRSIYEQQAKVRIESHKSQDFNIEVLKAAREIYTSLQLQQIQLLEFEQSGQESVFSLASKLTQGHVNPSSA